MSSISNWLSPDSGFLKIAIVAAVVVAAALILAVVYRLVFGHRLRVPGASRARQPRLGLVDAFSLDGQRQLVLVRRDNVEHLIMIGGPNDVLLESQIVRAVAAAPREPSLKPPVVAVETAQASIDGAPPRLEAPILRRVEPAPPRAPAARPPPPPLREAPPRIEPTVIAPEPHPVRPEPAHVRPLAAARPESGRAAPPPLVVPPPPPVASPPVASPPVVPPPAVSPAPLAVVPPRPAAPARGGLPPPIGTPPAIRGRATPLPAPHEAPAAVPPPPVAPPARADARPAAPPPLAEAGAAAKPKGDDPFADLESLEAEMARLLGLTAFIRRGRFFRAARGAPAPRPTASRSAARRGA
jgi:hypothetical protein